MEFGIRSPISGGVSINKQDWNSQLPIILAHFGDEFEPYTCKILKIFLEKYVVVFNTFDKNFGNVMNLWTKVDWTINYVMRPSFFDNDLQTRVNNIMLVSALLITITATAFMTPPLVGDNTVVTNRVLSYMMFTSTICFLVSIFTGVSFIENGLSRNYTDGSRMVNTIRYYHVFNSCQSFMFAGVIFLLFGLVVSAGTNYPSDDAIVFAVVIVVISCLCAYVMIQFQDVVGKGQQLQTNFFIDNFLYEGGKLKPGIQEWLNEKTQDDESAEKTE